MAGRQAHKVVVSGACTGLTFGSASQEIVAELHCNKGIGKEHAKWSPVGRPTCGASQRKPAAFKLADSSGRSAATASYRLLPTIDLIGYIDPSLHEKFQGCFPPGVIDIASGRIVVQNPRADTVSREVLRHAEFQDKVRLGRVRDHFICETC